MNYSLPIKQYLPQKNDFYKYKEFVLSSCIFLIILLSPVYLALILAFTAYCILFFLFNVLSSSTNYLEAWVKKSKENVGPAAEAIIFLITTPFIFYTHIVLSIFSVIFYLVGFVLQCLSYAATLGATKWRFKMSSSPFDNEPKSEN